MSSASVCALRSIENHCTPIGAARHALGLRVERAAQGRHHIGAGAPVGADRDLDAGGSGLDLLGDGAEQLVAHDVERDAAGGARGHGDRHRVARLVFRLVERDLQHVGRVGAGFGVPAGVEADRGDRPVGVRARHFEAIAAPLHRRRDAARLVGRDIDPAVGDAARRLDRLVLPAAVAAIILIARVDLEQFVAQPLARQRLAVGRDQRDVEVRVLALAERAAGEQRLHADHVAGGDDRQRDACARPRGRRLRPAARSPWLPAGATSPAPCRARPRSSPCPCRRSAAGLRAACGSVSTSSSARPN